MSRECSNWLQSYLEYTENHESPTIFHFWTGVICISSATRANLWMDRGRYQLFPNQYCIFVSDSAFLRRSVAQKLGINGFLRKIPNQIIFSDRITPEGVLDSIQRTVLLPDGRKIDESTALIWAPELPMMFGGASDVVTRSTAIFLTDVYEGKKEHQHTTRSGGHQKYFNLVLNFFGSTAPDWLEKLPEEMVGGGFTGRIHFITAAARKRAIAWPEPSAKESKLAQPLLNDLISISKLRGEMVPTPQCKESFRKWYEEDLANRKTTTVDFRSKPYFERIHDHALKLAMVYSLSEGDSLSVERKHLEDAIRDVELIYRNIPNAISTLGATEFYKMAEKVFSMVAGGPPLGVKHSDILRAVSYKLDANGMKAVIQLLIDQHRIEVKSGKGPTRYIVCSTP